MDEILIESTREWILKRLEETLPRYCFKCKKEFPPNAERCEACGDEILERLFPPNSTHNFSVVWAVPHWIRYYARVITRDSTFHDFKGYVNNNWGSISLNSRHYAYDIAQAMDPDFLETTYKEFMNRRAMETGDFCMIGGEYFDLSEIASVIEPYHPRKLELEEKAKKDRECQRCKLDRDDCQCVPCVRCSDFDCDCETETCGNCDEYLDGCSCDPEPDHDPF